MKTKLFSFFLALAASVGIIFAERVQIGDLYYNLNTGNRTAEVTYGDNYSGLTSADIPSSVTDNNLTYSVTSIGDGAFSYCYSLTSVYNYATTPQAINSDVFEEVNKNTCTLYVPEESIVLYQSADVWKDFGSIKAAPELSAVEQIRQNTKPLKTITNGQLLIINNGKTYTALGAVVK